MGGRDSKELQTTPSDKTKNRNSVIALDDDKRASLVSYQKSPDPHSKTDFSEQDRRNEEQYESSCTTHVNKRTDLAGDLPDTHNHTNEMEVSVEEEVAELVPVIRDNIAVFTPQVSSLPATPQLNIAGNVNIVHHCDSSVIYNATEQESTKARRQLSYTENLRGQMEIIANWHEKKGHLFVETKAHRELRTILDDFHWVTLLGKPGDGKSTTAANLLLEYRRKGYDPVFITSVHDWKALITAEVLTKQVVLIDDMFGTSCLEQGKVGEWRSFIENMEKLVDERKGNLLVICTSRRYIFSEIESSLARFKCFRKFTIVDMTDKNFKLSSEEKEKIFESLANENNVLEVKGCDVKDIESPHGFPLCAEMFCVNSFLRKDGLEFFRNPTECVQKEINNLKDNDNYKYIVLLTVLLKRNLVPRDYFDSLYDVATDDEKRFFKHLGVSLKTAGPELVKSRDALINTYLITNKDGHYTFIHETLMENVADVYLRTSPFHAVELVEFKYIAGYVNRLLKLNKTIPENLLEPISKRVTNEIEKGNVLEMCCCDVWNSDTFVETWIEYLQSDMKSFNAKDILRSKDTVANGWDIQYKIISSLSKMNYSPVTSLELKQAALCSVINTLIFCNRIQAVVLLLKDDVILCNLEEPCCCDLLQLGLEIACVEDTNIEVIKAIAQTKIGKRLNGSKALALSLALSNAENATTLLQNTDVSSQYSDSSGRGLFHYLTDSSINIDKFESLANMLADAHLNINETDITGEPLIFSLAEILMKQKDGFERFQVLRGAGANINITDTAGRNVVLYSLEKLCHEGCWEILKSLEGTQIDFHCTDHHGANAMHYFCANTGDVSSVNLFKFLVDEKAVNVSQTDNSGKIPLMLALLNMCPNYCISYLMQHSPNGHIDKFGRGLFHYLCGSNAQGDQFIDVCDKLLKNGENVNHLDLRGISPLFECVRNTKASVEHIKHLVACGAKIDTTDVNGRNIVLHTISWRRRHAGVQRFLSYFLEQAGVSFLKCDNDSKNALHYFFDSDAHDEYMINSFDAVCDFLITVARVDCHQPDNDGITPVMLGLEHYPDLDCVNQLASKAIPNVTDKRGRNYFHFLVCSNASDETFQEICSVLVENGIDINHKDNHGRSPLFDCLFSQKLSRMEYLVKCGARADPSENWTEQVIAQENITERNSILEEAGLEFEPDAVSDVGNAVTTSSHTSDEDNNIPDSDGASSSILC